MLIHVLPVSGQGFLRAPGGVVGGHPISDSTYRTQSTPKMALGSIAIDPLTGNFYMLVKAGASIPISSAVTFNGTALNVIQTSAANQLVAGVADTAFNNNDTGWIMVEGNVVVLANAAVVAGNLLVTFATAGTLQLATATDLISRGISAINAASGGVCTCYLA